jgi:hypothetical protein
MRTKTVQLRVFTHDSGHFKNVRGENVLLYWPHGFGDWIQFSSVLRFLDPTNQYWMTRFGDDTVTVMNGHLIAKPIYLGVNSPHCDDGGLYGIKNFRLTYQQFDGRAVDVVVPQVLYQFIVQHHITSMLWTWYPETHGSESPPYHTKARRMAAHLTERLPESFSVPLPSSLSLKSNGILRQIVEARLTNYCGFGDRQLCLVGRGGYTSVGKNWGHLWREDLPEGQRSEGAECRDFIQLMLKKNPNWCFLLMEDRNFGDSLKSESIQTYTYADLFGEPEHAIAPFGQIMKCLVQFSSLCVGVPAGPYHFAAQVEALPTVGIWIEHLPSWYDEPRDGLTHVIGSKPAAFLTDPSKPGSFIEWGPFKYNTHTLSSRTISGTAVMEAAETVMEGNNWRRGSKIVMG